MTIKLLAGDARDVLPTLAADSVHCVVTSPPYYALRSYLDATHPDKHREIGSESSPDEYLATMVAVFREIRRVMRPDAVAFVNMGDGYRDKQLLLMPARLALALQADGWWVRSDIIWHKPNPMPESCTDRPTSAHEHVFLLTKSARYFYDADAVREEHNDTAGGVERFGNIGSRGGYHGGVYGDPCVRPDLPKAAGGRVYNPAGRNLRNVWTIATSPFSAAHFATYPPELAERCIRAGTSERGCCAACGKPWARVTEQSVIPLQATNNPAIRDAGVRTTMPRCNTEVTTTGWAPGCDHNADVVPCRVLDPFFGAGTTGLVAERLQRDCIGIDLNPDYNVMSRARIEADAPLFTSFPPAEDPEESRMADLFADAEYHQLPPRKPGCG